MGAWGLTIVLKVLNPLRYCCPSGGAAAGRWKRIADWNIQQQKIPDASCKSQVKQLLAQIFNVLRKSWYKKYTPEPKSLPGHLRADGKFWALLILLLFQSKKKVRNHIIFRICLPSSLSSLTTATLWHCKKETALLKSESVARKTNIFHYLLNKKG